MGRSDAWRAPGGGILATATDIHLAGSRQVVTTYGFMPCRCSRLGRALRIRIPCVIAAAIRPTVTVLFRWKR